MSLSLAAWLLSYEFWAVLQARYGLQGRDCEPLRLVRELRQSHLPHVQASTALNSHSSRLEQHAHARKTGKTYLRQTRPLASIEALLRELT